MSGSQSKQMAATSLAAVASAERVKQLLAGEKDGWDDDSHWSPFYAEICSMALCSARSRASMLSRIGIWGIFTIPAFSFCEISRDWLKPERHELIFWIHLAQRRSSSKPTTYRMRIIVLTRLPWFLSVSITAERRELWRWSKTK